MKIFSLLSLIFLSFHAYTQNNFPVFIQGTWKMEMEERYESWTLIEPGFLKGYAYELKDGVAITTEFLELKKNKKKILYSALVPGQNENKPVSFSCIKSDSSYIYENKNHDFPKQIVYRIIAQDTMEVELWDNNSKRISYILSRCGVKYPNSDNPLFDPHLAQKFNADAYGMSSYYLVLLKSGKNKTTDKDSIQTAFRGHMQNINRLVEEGLLLVAGPFGKNDLKYRGLFIFTKLPDKESLHEVLSSDPAIKEGFLDYEILDWYGSAALPAYLPYSHKVWQKKP